METFLNIVNLVTPFLGIASLLIAPIKFITIKTPTVVDDKILEEAEGVLKIIKTLTDTFTLNTGTKREPSKSLQNVNKVLSVLNTAVLNVGFDKNVK